tara:strand:- start:40 stop:744 length:705 start_codon:yes stop_codon:yes gene_type:complete
MQASVRDSVLLEMKDGHRHYEVEGQVVRALRGATVAVSTGDSIAIMGPSGCGKTTLLNCLSGIDRLSNGDVYFDGSSTSEMDDIERTRLRAESMGFIFQSFNLIEVLSAVENVEIPMLLKNHGRNEARLAAIDALDRVGLRDRIHHRPNELSGGQQQRVAIARAMVHKPAVIFADEPTGALDETTGHEIMDALLAVNEEAGSALLVVTHDDVVGSRCSRQLRMLDGAVVSELAG